MPDRDVPACSTPDRCRVLRRSAWLRITNPADRSSGNPRQLRLPATGYRLLAVLRAFLAHTVPSQIIPGINPAPVPVVPLEADRVIAHRARRLRPRRRLIHRQQRSRLRLPLARLPPLRLALFVAGRAWTGVPQPRKTPPAAMPIFPVDLETLARRLLHPHLRRRYRIAGQFPRVRATRFFQADQANPFVTHTPLTGATSFSLTAFR